jgi:hypothetical protein
MDADYRRRHLDYFRCGAFLKSGGGRVGDGMVHRQLRAYLRCDDDCAGVPAARLAAAS